MKTFLCHCRTRRDKQQKVRGIKNHIQVEGELLWAPVLT